MLIGNCSCLLWLDDVLLGKIMSKDFFIVVEMLQHDVFASVGMNELEHTIAKSFVAVVNGSWVDTGLSAYAWMVDCSDCDYDFANA